MGEWTRIEFAHTAAGWGQVQDATDVLPELVRTVLVEGTEADRNQVIYEQASVTQGSIDIASGCLMANRLFITDDNEPNLLLVAVHHLQHHPR